ncbi:glycosyltransferase [Paenibacillus eucommiae]|uniref:Glycosyltransferase involved in cell wall biosynthesis n=1 Tax=Paenibacillus eucommiae TaxID=1355755 RepID=A0ABS4ITT3_9BACL|nr:glycosyltransferase [Paenibacillus eucommiae]MBP1990984.1 glycosyltransferase involved in cell wall biosynthesis [Paenibacillus eucommiae]
MKQTNSAILHHKYSLEDGHVTPQINGIDGYRGVMMTRKSKEKRLHSPFSNVLSVDAIKQNPDLLKQSNVVGIHIHHGSLAPKFLFLKEKYGLPMFVGFRGNDATAYPKKKQNLLKLKKLFRSADMFFPVCEHLKRKIIKLGCPEDKIRVLYGGVDLDRFKSRSRKVSGKEKIRFLAIGRFVEKKGFGDLIRAFADVKKRHSNIKLTLVGQGPSEAEYRKLIKKLQLGSSVQIIPWVNYRKIQDKYYRSHVFCAPSCTSKDGNQEGIPNTLKEAMATGMPVISTTHAGIPELVKNKISGLLVPERSVNQLAKAMNWLINNPKSWAKLGENARKKVESDFNMALQLKKQKKYYDEILKHK